MNRLITNDWWEILESQFTNDSFRSLLNFLKNDEKLYQIYPPKEQLFKAYELSSFADTKVVILGQDPYHGLNQAQGLSFSVNPGIKLPPSLRNIYQELENDLSIKQVKNGDLSKWASQGILLLNSVLTVRDSMPNSHQNQGWEKITDATIKALSDKKSPVVFILWGAFAQKKESLINKNNNLIIKSPHPSPLSAYRGFFGSKPFSKTNEYLIAKNQTPINWQIL